MSLSSSVAGCSSRWLDLAWCRNRCSRHMTMSWQNNSLVTKTRSNLRSCADFQCIVNSKNDSESSLEEKITWLFFVSLVSLLCVIFKHCIRKNWELHMAILFVFLYMEAAKRRFEENSTHNEVEHTGLIIVQIFFLCFFILVGSYYDTVSPSIVIFEISSGTGMQTSLSCCSQYDILGRRDHWPNSLTANTVYGVNYL
jgi:hypothetical protein